MKATQTAPPRRRFSKALLIPAALLVAAVTSNGNIMYVSFGDRTGNSRPNTIEMYDTSTGQDLGVFANASSGLSLPEGLALNSAGDLFVANYGNNTIEEFTPGGVGTIFANTGLNGPTALGFDSAGNLYVANYWANSIEEFTPTGVGTVFATNGISFPVGLAFNSAGNLYVANAGTVTIERFTPGGVGSLFPTTGLGRPLLGGMTFDSAGNLYVGCQGTSEPVIERITPGGVGSVFAAAESSGLAFDNTGNLFTANYGDNSIQEFSAGGAQLSYDPTANSPYGIAIVPEPSVLAILALSSLLVLCPRSHKRRWTARQDIR
jgi:hypothetical protein